MYTFNFKLDIPINSFIKLTKLYEDSLCITILFPRILCSSLFILLTIP